MNPERSAVMVVVATVLTVSVASGPLVPGVQPARTGEFPSDLHSSFGSELDGISVDHRLSYDAAPLPGSGQLRATDGDDYAVDVAPAAVDVRTGATSAVVTCRLRVPGLDHSQRVERRVGANRTARVDLSFPERTVPGDRVTARSYEGVLVVTVTQGDRTFEAARTTVSLEVDG